MSQQSEGAAGCGCLLLVVIGIIIAIARGCGGDDKGTSPPTQNKAPKSTYQEIRKMENVRETEPAAISVFERQYEAVPKAKN
ncbi:MAG: hypothetical protein FJ271_07655 [Planctomycetes bacterium]|nr:hypothetical protein [Planctomycetota bacterium]